MKRMKNTTELVFAAALLAASAACAGITPAAAPDVGDYVQDGLIIHFDGICNVGTNAAHSYTTNRWINLGSLGDTHSMTLTKYNASSTQLGEWLEDGYRFGGQAKFVTGAKVTFSSSFTWEGLLSGKSADQPHATTAYLMSASYNNLAFTVYRNSGGKLYYRTQGANYPGNCPGFDLKDGFLGYFSAVLDSANSDAYMFSGTDYPTDSMGKKSYSSLNGTPAESTFAIGGWGGDASGNDASYFKGVVKSIRHYNRKLSSGELAWNRMVDEARYNGGYSLAKGATIIVGTSIPGVEGAEASGPYVVDSAGHTFTAPESISVPGGGSYTLDGYTLRVWNDETGWGEAQFVAGSSYAATSGTKVWLVWDWTYQTPGLDVGDYVQRGLFLHYDGIRNAGAAALHDGAATTWKNIAPGQEGRFDLVASPDSSAANPLTADYLATEAPHDFWVDDGYHFGDNKVLFVYNNSAAQIPLPASFTIQALVDGTSAEQPASFTFYYTNETYQTKVGGTITGPDCRTSNITSGNSIMGYVFYNYSNWDAGSISIRRDSNPHPVSFVTDKINGSGRPLFTTPENIKSEDPSIAYFTSSRGIAQGTRYSYITAMVSNKTSVAFCGTEFPTANDLAHGSGYYANGTNISSRQMANLSIGGSVSQHFKGTIKSIRFYTNTLSNAELAQNRRVDEARFFGRLQETNAVVSCWPPALKGAQANGAYSVGSGGFTFSAPEEQTDHAGVVWRCVGHTLEQRSGAGWGSPATSTATTRSVAQTDHVRITWRYEPKKGLRAPSGYDVGDYVRDGLVLHYDGIRNAGPDSPHVTNSVFWCNLAGKSFDLRRIRYGNVSAGQYAYSDGTGPGHWEDDGFFYDGASYFVARQRWSVPAKPHFTMQMRGELNGQEQTGEGGIGYIFLPGGGYVPGSMAVRAKDLNVSGDEPCVYMVTDYWSTPSRPTVRTATATYFTGVADGTRFAGTDAATLAGATWISAGTEKGDYVGYGHFSLGGFHSGDRCGGQEAECPYGKLQNFRYYDRVLTNDELAWNRMVDDARFDGTLPETNVVVAAALYRPEDQTEAEGIYKVEGEWTFTARDTYDEGKLRRLVGYTLEIWNDSTESWTSRRNYQGVEYTYRVGVDPARVRLTWRWQKPPTLMIFR